MSKTLEMIHGFLWGIPVLVLILGVGLYLSICSGFAQITLLPRALRTFVRRMRPGVEAKDGVSPFQALCTALAATVGTGNLVGVAGAICLGGPGAIFWMWICGLLGMATKFAEATLAVRYRVRDGDSYKGGPMYMMLLGGGDRWRPLACLYSMLGVFAAFGVGNATQINAVVTGINGVLLQLGGRETWLGNLLMGIGLGILVGAMLSGGARRIGLAAERLVPFASGGYLLLCIGVLILRRDAIPMALKSILLGAWNPRAVTGGVLGSVFQALKVGCCRGVFTNEAGMGTASIAHASAAVDHPVEQGLMGIVEVFLDTIVICTMTALAILSSGVSIPYGQETGGILTEAAFSRVYGDWAGVLIAGALCCFAFATVLGWGLYGARCAEFLFGSGAWRWFARLQTAAVVFGAVLDTHVVWMLAETVNGLMTIPNLLILAALSPEVRRLTMEYKEKNRLRAGGGTICRYRSTQTAVNPLPCESSIPMRLQQRKRENTSIT